jgi:hypothetical protein
VSANRYRNARHNTALRPSACQLVRGRPYATLALPCRSPRSVKYRLPRMKPNIQPGLLLALRRDGRADRGRKRCSRTASARASGVTVGRSQMPSRSAMPGIRCTEAVHTRGARRTNDARSISFGFRPSQKPRLRCSSHFAFGTQILAKKCILSRRPAAPLQGLRYTIVQRATDPCTWRKRYSKTGWQSETRSSSPDARQLFESVLVAGFLSRGIRRCPASLPLSVTDSISKRSF